MSLHHESQCLISRAHLLTGVDSAEARAPAGPIPGCAGGRWPHHIDTAKNRVAKSQDSSRSDYGFARFERGSWCAVADHRTSKWDSLRWVITSREKRRRDTGGTKCEGLTSEEVSYINCRSLHSAARHRAADTAGTHNSRSAVERRRRAAPVRMTHVVKTAVPRLASGTTYRFRRQRVPILVKGQNFSRRPPERSSFGHRSRADFWEDAATPFERKHHTH